MEKDELAFNLASAFNQPVQVQQYASSLPEEAKVLPREAEHQFTRDDVARTIDRKMRTTIHYLNPPLSDGLNAVGAIEKALADAAFNYQQEHVTSYYEMFPRLTQKVLTTDELAHADSTWLRLNYKLISTRVAHRIWHYTQASLMLAASFVNMLNLGRYEGSDVNFKSVASAFRFTRLNTITPNYAKFPKLKGSEDYLISNGVYLAGQANDGTPIISIPIFTSDIFGNRGWHHLPLSTFASLDGLDYIDPDTLITDGEPEDDFKALQYNVSKTILNYARKVGIADTRLPQIENMGLIYYENGENFSASARSGGGGEQSEYYRGFSDSSAFIKSIYNNYYAWNNYITKYFADFADITSDWYKLVTSTLGICEESKTVSAMVSAVRGTKYATVKDYLDQSRFGASNKATCATIVKYMPLFDDEQDQSSPSFISTNFERYKFWKDDMRAVIRDSLRYPKLTPTVFESSQGTNEIDTYYVGNTGPNYVPANQEGLPVELFDGTSPLVYGQRALFDLARAVSVDVEVDQVVTIGLSKEASLAIANRDTTSKVYDELRSALFVDILPLIDDTDPYVCGLHYFFSHDSALKSQTELTLSDANNARLIDNLDVSTPGTARGIPKLTMTDFSYKDQSTFPLSESFGVALNDVVDTPALAAHIVNDDYYADRKHVVVFGGVGACEDAVNAALIQNSGGEFKRVNVAVSVGAVYKALGQRVIGGDELTTLPIFLAQMVNDLTPRHSTDSANSIGALLYLMKELSNHLSSCIIEYTLPLTYGPVPINAIPSPLRYARTILSLIPSTTKAGQRSPVPGIQLFQTGYCSGGAHTPGYDKPLAYMASRIEDVDKAIEKSIFGISHYVMSKLDTSGYVDIQSGSYKSPALSPLIDGKLRLMGTTFVKAMGERNTVAFWDQDHAATIDLADSKLRGSIDFKRNDYVAEVNIRQNIKDITGGNGTSSKQGESPRFVSSNVRSGRKSGRNSNRWGDSSNKRDETYANKSRGKRRNNKRHSNFNQPMNYMREDISPEKPMDSSSSNATPNNSGSKSEQKPFLQSVAPLATNKEEQAVIKAQKKSGVSESTASAM